jgi:hypothetical protein
VRLVLSGTYPISSAKLPRSARRASNTGIDSDVLSNPVCEEFGGWLVVC